MLHFIKVFLITLFISLIAIFGGLYGYIKATNPLDELTSSESTSPIDIIDDNDTKAEDNSTPFEKAKNNSKRINVLLVGLEGVRTDTIMLVSFDRESKDTNIISIPRDTYYEREQYDMVEMQKINAIYQNENIDGLIDAVEKLTDVPVHRYVLVDYQAVNVAVDAVGGVEFEVPLRMLYHDEYANPPLIIDIQPGTQLITGKNALGLLRFRQNDDRTIKLGDLGRIEIQQNFIKAAVKKAISFKLPSLIREVYSYVDTNFTLTELTALTMDLTGFTTDKLETTVLPAKLGSIDSTSFVFPKAEEIVQLMYSLYGLSDNE